MGMEAQVLESPHTHSTVKKTHLKCGGGGGEGAADGGGVQLSSIVALLIAALRKSMVSSCRRQEVEEMAQLAVTVHQMEIGWPTDVKHVTHVTFDRYNGFLGLPIEFELEVPKKPPSASASVFGVSAESMQCSYDSKGNSVPTILLLMQEHLYTEGGLKTEGIFRINPENSEEEQVRDQLNRGVIPQDIDVHCLAGLIKAWFRELPSGVLDGLSPEQVLQCSTEEDFVELVKQLAPTQSALLNWAVELMVDVVEEEENNKMNARNIAMVFAPNMTQMSDPLMALMHAVQVMNLLKSLILKTLRERQESATVRGYSSSSPSSPGGRSGEEWNSQEEEEEEEEEAEADRSCESRRYSQSSEDDDNLVHYVTSSGEDERESSYKIEECFLSQLTHLDSSDDECWKPTNILINKEVTAEIPKEVRLSPKTPDQNAIASAGEEEWSEFTPSGSSNFKFTTTTADSSALSVSPFKSIVSFSASDDEDEEQRDRNMKTVQTNPTSIEKVKVETNSSTNSISSSPVLTCQSNNTKPCMMIS